ncbi:amino acid adenylation domain-containing protein [Streptomyces sp. NPDC088387]|uniref:amino acid adenylation domain-containing protein n=1 Tax=Streptomyces sp. NPDC088387 TaxID=3365859 RepID=UPI00380BEBE5
MTSSIAAQGSALAEMWPLSPLQEGLLFHSAFDDDGPDVYAVQFALGIDGPLDVERLRVSWQALLRRHAALRASFQRRKNGKAVQLITRNVPLPWRDADLSDLAEPELRTRAEELAARERAERMDLAVPPLLRFLLIRLGERRHRLIVTSHHLLMDGWSMPVLLGELSAVYQRGGDTSGLSRAASYGEYLAWLNRQDGDAARAAWRTELAGLDEPTLVAAPDRDGEPLLSAESHVELRPEATGALADWARTHGLTVNTVVQGAWALVLARLARRTDVVFGATVAGRPAELPGVESMVGLLINTLPVRVPLDGRQTVAEMLTRLQERQSALIAHQHLGLAEIQRTAGPGAVFDTLVVFENYPRSDGEPTVPGMPAFSVSAGSQATNYPLTLGVLVTDRLQARISYLPDVFDREQADEVGRRFVRVLERLVAQPDTLVGRIDVLDDDERSRVINTWNDTTTGLPGVLVPESFAWWASVAPDVVAVRCGEVALSYGELEERADRLARALVRLGVGREVCVGVCLPRSVDVVVAELAVWLAGGAFVPLDREYPVERLEFMVADCGVRVVVGEGEPFGDVPWVSPDTPEVGSKPLPALELSPDQLAYVIYTSGSTGRPKGVAVAHGGLANLVQAMRPVMGVQEGTGVLQFASFSFDAAVLDVAVTLASGGTLAIATKDERADVGALARMMASSGVETASVVPSLLSVLDPDTVPGVRTWVLGAELLTADLASRWADRVRLVNTYGPTEATVMATAGAVNPGIGPQDQPPTIGRPLGNVHTYVLDELLQPVPPGITGELYLAGPGVARGYAGRAGMTGERFVACPWDSGARMYRTGDLARWTPDGDLLFAGRADAQVKVRGFRVELGEIETVLAAHEDVAQAAVVVRHDRLVGYVVPVAGTLDIPAARAHLSGRLPEFMVPTALIALDALPLTVNGKVDRAALPAPDFADRPVGRAPRTANERLLCELFAEVLGLDRVGVDDSFFGLGGDSISSMQLASRARRAGLAVTPRQVFEHKTPERLATVTDPVADGSAPEDTGTGAIAWTPAMRALGQAAVRPGFAQWMIVGAPAGLGLDVLTAGLAAVLDRHDMLRARALPGEHTLVVGERGSVDAAALVSRVEAGSADVGLLAREAAAGLDPVAGVNVRVVWVDAGPNEVGRLVVVAHHLVVDGVSWRVLLPDLQAACEAVAAGREPALDPVATSFRRWSQLLAAQAVSDERVAELDAWTTLLGEPERPVGRRALDPAVDTAATLRRRAWAVPAQHAAALVERVPGAFHCGVHEVLLAGLAGAVARLRQDGSGEVSAVLVDVEGHGREPAEGVDLSRTVGWFSSSHPVRLDVPAGQLDETMAGGPAAGSLVKAVKEQVRAVPGDGLGYELLRHINPGTAPVLAAAPAPQIGFNYLGRFPAGSPAETVGPWQPEGTIGAAGDEDRAARHALEAGAVVRDTSAGPTLTIVLTWAERLLTETEAELLGETWLAMLGGLAGHTTSPDAGGHTPSDFPLLDLAQDEVDEFETDFADVDQN